MIVVPLKEELFKSRAIPRIMHALAAGQKPDLPKATVSRAIRLLKQADLVGSDLSVQAPLIGDRIALNPRDLYVHKIFKSRFMGPVLDALSKGEEYGIRELATILRFNPMAVKRVMDDLRAAKLLEGGRLKQEAFYQPTDALDCVPRIVHRKALRYFISFIEREPCIDAVIAYGNAAIGKLGDLELLIIRRLTEQLSSLEEMDVVDGNIVLKAARAAHQVTAAYASMRIQLAIVGAFDWHSYQYIAKPLLSTRLYRASQGITVYGDASPSLVKLFEDFRLMSPLSPDELTRAMERGYVVRTQSGFEATMKWVNEYVAPATTKASEDQITVDVDSNKVTIPRIVLVKEKQGYESGSASRRFN